ncbi:unnamed protein product [Trichobilharzia szidati]|nr:unnamed protein product [Trichobilharzia szidati]
MDFSSRPESYHFHSMSRSLSIIQMKRRSTLSFYRNSRSASLPPDFRININYQELLEAFNHYYTSLPITIHPENSLIIMKDMYKSRKDMPTKVIAPDGYIPNSKVRLQLKPAKQIKSSDEKIMGTLSSITSMKDVCLLKAIMSNKLPLAIEKVRAELVTSAAIEVEALVEQPCVNIYEEDILEEDETARIVKTAKMQQIAKQLTKQTIQQLFEKKIQENLERIEAEKQALFEYRQEKEHALGEQVQQKEEDSIDRFGLGVEKTIERKKEEERSRTLPDDMVEKYLQEMTEQWGSLSKVMDLFYDAVKKDASSIESLDKYFRSRNIRVGMINSILSPTWLFRYLTNVFGGPRTLLEHIETILDPNTTIGVIHSVRTQFAEFLGDKQRLEVFLHSFLETRNILQNYLTKEGLSKEEAITIINEAICDSLDAKNKIRQALRVTDIQELIESVKMCDSEKVTRLVEESMNVSKSLPRISAASTDAAERHSKRRSQGITDARPSTTQKPIGAVDDTKHTQKKKLPTIPARLVHDRIKQVKIKTTPITTPIPSEKDVREERKSIRKSLVTTEKKEEVPVPKEDHIVQEASKKPTTKLKQPHKEDHVRSSTIRHHEKPAEISKISEAMVKSKKKLGKSKTIPEITIHEVEEEKFEQELHSKHSEEETKVMKDEEETYLSTTFDDIFEDIFETEEEEEESGDFVASGEEAREKIKEKEEEEAKTEEDELFKFNGLRFEADFEDPALFFKVPWCNMPLLFPQTTEILQFGLNKACIEQIIGYAEKLFAKCYQIIKESINAKQKARENAFVYGLSALTILHNFGIVVNDHLELIEEAFLSFEAVEEERIEKKHKPGKKHKKELDSSATDETIDSQLEFEDFLETETDAKTIESKRRVKRPHKEKPPGTPKTKKVKRRKSPTELSQSEDTSSLKRQAIEPYKRTRKAEEMEEGIESESLEKDTVSKAHKLTSLKAAVRKHIVRDQEKRAKVERDAVTGQLKVPAIQRKLTPKEEKERILSKLKQFLNQQTDELHATPAPSLSLENLMSVLEDSSKSVMAEEILLLLAKEFNIDANNPDELINRIKEQMDSGKHTDKVTPINKLFNLLSVLTGVDNFDDDKSTDIENFSQMNILEKAEFLRQKKKMIKGLCDDIEAQLKYNRTKISEMSASSRAIWFTIESQAQSNKEMCEKIVFLYEQNAISSQLASVIVEDFILDILDGIAILENEELLLDDEEKILYEEINDKLDILSLFGLKSDDLMKRFEPTLLSGVQIDARRYGLHVKLPSSYADLIERIFLANFVTSQFLEDIPRQPLEKMYAGIYAGLHEEISWEEKIIRKSHLEQEAKKSVMTQDLSLIKQTFQEPWKYLDMNSPLIQISKQLSRGIRQAADRLDHRASLKETERDIMAYETTKMQISGKQTTPKGLQKKEIGIMKRPLFLLGKEREDDSRMRMKGKQYIPESVTENIFPDDATIFPVRSHVGAMMEARSQLPLIMAKAPKQSGPIQPTSFAVRFAQKPPKRRMLGKRAKVIQSLSPIESSQYSPQEKFTPDTHKQVALMSLEAKSRSESASTHEVEEHTYEGLKKDGRYKMEFIPHSMINLEESESQMEPPSTTSYIQTRTSTPTFQQGPQVVSPESYRVAQHKIHGMYKTLSDESKHTLSQDIRTLELTYQRDSETKTIDVWTWFDKILASKPVPLSSTEGMIKKQIRKKRKALLSSSKTKYKEDEQSEQTASEIEKPDSESTESYEKIFQRRCTGSTFDFTGKFRIPKWLEQRLYEDLGSSLSTGIKIQEKDISNLPMIPTRSHGSKTKMKKPKEPSPDKMKQFRNDLQIAVSHLKYILHPAQLTRLLIDIKSEIPTLETIRLFEKLLVQAAQKARDSKHMEEARTHELPRLSQINLEQQRKTFHPSSLTDIGQEIRRKLHCRYETLARKGYQNLGLSISAHIARMELVEYMQKSIQQRGKYNKFHLKINCLYYIWKLQLYSNCNTLCEVHSPMTTSISSL